MGDVIVNRLAANLRFMEYSVTPTLEKLLEEFNPDIVHCHGYRSYQTEHAATFSIRRKVPYVITMHGTATGYRFMTTNPIAIAPYVVYDFLRKKTVLKGAAALVVSSTFEEGEVRKFAGNSCNLVRIPGGTVIPKFESIN